MRGVSSALSRVCVIAGEQSGDNLGEVLLQELKINTPNLICFGLGGKMMQSQGFESMFDISETSVMGFSEVIPKIPHILKRIRQLAYWIAEKKPQVVITIDSPDFCFRVAKKLRKIISEGEMPKFYHYVAPTVWAYRERRAEKIAKLYDAIFCILPFEPQYFIRYGLPAYFVGYQPVYDVRKLLQEYSKQRVYEVLQIEPSKKLVAITLGSRISEVERHGKIIIPLITQILEKHKDIIICIPTTHASHNVIEQMISQNFPQQNDCFIITSDENKKNLIRCGCEAAVTKSGTNAFEFSACKVPIAVYYQTNFVTYLITKLLVRIKFANLINILADKMIIPELLQYDATPQNLFNAFELLLQSPQIQTNQTEQYIDQFVIDETPANKIVGIINTQQA